MSIKERKNERPGLPRLPSHLSTDADADDPYASIRNPPTEYMADSHPASSEDSRSKETASIAKNIESKVPEIQRQVFLPRGETEHQQKGAEELHRSQSHQLSQNKQTLLLVEDNLVNQKVLRRQLQSRGFEVFVANNGQEAVNAVLERGRVVEDNPNERNYFDCILMDQEMPVKDGNVATQEIRELQQERKAGYGHILGVSANVREAQMKGMRDAGMDDVISKPFKVDDLVKKIDSLISNAGGEKSSRKPKASPRNTKESGKAEKGTSKLWVTRDGEQAKSEEQPHNGGEREAESLRHPHIDNNGQRNRKSHAEVNEHAGQRKR